MTSTMTMTVPVSPTVSALTGADIWLATVESAIELFRTHAVHTVSVELVAAAAQLDPALLDEQFPAMDDVILSAVQVWNARRIESLLPIAQTRGAFAFLRAMVVADIADPALPRLFAVCANISATPDHPMAPVLQRSWLQFHAQVLRALMGDVAAGREADSMEPARAAEQLIALYEGLQVQSMMRPHMDLLKAWDRAVDRLRDGWSRRATAPTWDI